MRGRLVSRKPKLWWLAAVTLLAWSVVASCGPADDHNPVAMIDARRLLTEAMRSRFGLHEWSPFAPPAVALFPDSIRFSADSSRVVPNLVYHEAVFPLGLHSTIVLGAGQLGTRSTVIDGPDDWAAVVGTGAWRPTSATDAEGVCGEVVTHAVRFPTHHPPVVVFRDSSELSLPRGGAPEPVTDRVAWLLAIAEGRAIAGGAIDTLAVRTSALLMSESDRSAILERVRPPVVRTIKPDRAWEVDLWAIEFGRTMKYRCHIGSGPRRMTIRIDPVDSLPCVGQLGRRTAGTCGSRE